MTIKIQKKKELLTLYYKLLTKQGPPGPPPRPGLGWKEETRRWIRPRETGHAESTSLMDAVKDNPASVDSHHAVNLLGDISNNLQNAALRSSVKQMFGNKLVSVIKDIDASDKLDPQHLDTLADISIAMLSGKSSTPQIEKIRDWLKIVSRGGSSKTMSPHYVKNLLAVNSYLADNPDTPITSEQEDEMKVRDRERSRATWERESDPKWREGRYFGD